mgnify:FL=1
MIVVDKLDKSMFEDIVMFYISELRKCFSPLTGCYWNGPKAAYECCFRAWCL